MNDYCSMSSHEAACTSLINLKLCTSIHRIYKGVRSAARCRGITCCQTGRFPVWLMHVLCSPLIQHLGTVLSKNTWHFRVSKANSQTKTEPVSFRRDGVIPGHLLVRRPERWACGEESMALFFFSPSNFQSVPCSWWWQATSCARAVRARWANGSESN